MTEKSQDPAARKDYWASLAARITDPVQTRNQRGDYSELEIEFLRPFLNPGISVLDLGSGTGLMVNRLVDLVGKVTAVEKFQGFSQYIKQSDKLELINADLVGFRLYREFDLVLATGVMQCLEGQYVPEIYKNVYNMTRAGGYFVAHVHCGINEDVIVDRFSEELNTQYYAEYRHYQWEREQMLKAGFESVELHDVFPDWLNKWPNTRHYLFVCHKAEG
ncbi:MAG: class I SAM-dependent methyltransferase [Gammaproteobacteria bacterium]|nr:class I SAM-dependent methyltransferase [Gammaproteobacteria bacterium]